MVSFSWQDKQRLIEKAWRVWRRRHLQSCVVQNFLEEEARSLLSQVSIYDYFNSVDLSEPKSTLKGQLVFFVSPCTKCTCLGRSWIHQGVGLAREIASSFIWVHLWVFFKALCQWLISLMYAPFLTTTRDVNPLIPCLSRAHSGKKQAPHWCRRTVLTCTPAQAYC